MVLVVSISLVIFMAVVASAWLMHIMVTSIESNKLVTIAILKVYNELVAAMYISVISIQQDIVMPPSWQSVWNSMKQKETSFMWNLTLVLERALMLMVSTSSTLVSRWSRITFELGVVHKTSILCSFVLYHCVLVCSGVTMEMYK